MSPIKKEKYFFTSVAAARRQKVNKPFCTIRKKKNIFPTDPLAFGQNPLFSRCKSIEYSINMDQKMVYLYFSLKTQCIYVEKNCK